MAQHNGAMEEDIVEIYHQRMFYDAAGEADWSCYQRLIKNSPNVNEIIYRLTAAGFQMRRREDTTGGTN